MDHLKTSPPLPTLPTTSFQQQRQRQMLGEHWMPAGIERYKQTVAIVNGMPVIGMDGNEMGYPNGRFDPPTENYG